MRDQAARVELGQEVRRRPSKSPADARTRTASRSIASGGAIAPPPGYMDELRRVCDRHEALLVFDETITAFGRTGEWFAACH